VNGSLGFRVVESVGTPYLRVAEIIPGGAAYYTEGIALGDHLLSVNGRDLNSAETDALMHELKTRDVVSLMLFADPSTVVPTSEAGNRNGGGVGAGEAASAQSDGGGGGSINGGGMSSPRLRTGIPAPVEVQGEGAPLGSEIQNLEAGLWGRSLVLNQMPPGPAIDTLREEYHRLFQFVETSKSIMGQIGSLQEEERVEGVELADQERATLVTALRQSTAARKEDAACYAEGVLELNKLIRQQAAQLEEQAIVLKQNEIDLAETLSENRRLAQALRQTAKMSLQKSIHTASGVAVLEMGVTTEM
jgi:hypothetical protein